MAGTSPLHWRIRKTSAGAAYVQQKFTCDDTMWSAISRVWTTKAPRPDGREFSEGFSGLLPSDLRLAPRKQLAEGRAKELTDALAGIKARVSGNAMEAWYRRITTLTSIEPDEIRTETPHHGGRFARDDHEVADDDSDSDNGQELEIPQHIIHETVSEQRRQTARRKKYGYSKTVVTVESYVTYTTDYTAETQEHEKQDFWMGQVTDINSKDDTLSIVMFHTSKLRNGDTSRGAKYTKWRGSPNECQLTLSRVLEVIDELSPTGIIPKKHVRYTMAALLLKREDARREVDTADTAAEEESSASSSSSSSDGSGTDTSSSE